MNINEIKTIEDLNKWYEQEYDKICSMGLPDGYECKMKNHLGNEYSTLANYILNK